jgi:hypothetical protein
MSKKRSAPKKTPAARWRKAAPGAARKFARGVQRAAGKPKDQPLFNPRDLPGNTTAKTLAAAARIQNKIKRLTKALKRETRAADNALVGLYHFLAVHPSIADDLKQQELNLAAAGDDALAAPAAANERDRAELERV